MTDPDSDHEPGHDQTDSDTPDDGEALFDEDELEDAGRTTTSNTEDTDDGDAGAADGESIPAALAAKLNGGISFLMNAIMASGVIAASSILGSRLFPKSEKLWLGVSKLALKKVKKSTGADMIGFLPGEGGQLQPTPMKIKQRDEDDSTYWATTANDVEYEPGPQGVSREYIGNVPVGFFVEDPPREVSLLEARVRDAIDLGQHQPLVDGDVTLHEHIHQPANAMEGGSGGDTAMADGGHSQPGMKEVFDRQMEIDASQIPKDGVIDLSTDTGNGARVSWNRVTDIFQDTPATEKMVMQEQRGELAGAAGNEEKIQRIALYAILGIVATVFIFYLGPSIVNAVFGSGSFGGMGGALPSIGG